MFFLRSLFDYKGGASHTKTKYPVIIKTIPLAYYFVIRGEGRLVLGEQDSCYMCSTGILPKIAWLYWNFTGIVKWATPGLNGSEQNRLGLNPSWNISWDTSAKSIQWYSFYQKLVHIQFMWPTMICRVFCTLVCCIYVKHVNGKKINPTSMTSSNNWLRCTQNIKPSPTLPERGWIVGGWWHKLIVWGYWITIEYSRKWATCYHKMTRRHGCTNIS
jgi:hypothetical protein